MVPSYKKSVFVLFRSLQLPLLLLLNNCECFVPAAARGRRRSRQCSLYPSCHDALAGRRHRIVYNGDCTLQRLAMAKNEGEEKKNQTASPSLMDDIVADPGLLASDLLSLAVASPLIGLLQVLNDSDFWNKGGWFQPVLAPTIPASLSNVIQTFCQSAVLWVIASIAFNGYQFPVSENDDRSGSGGNVEMADTFTDIFRQTVPICAGFALLRGVLFALLMDENWDTVWDVLLQVYAVALVITAGRFVYCQLNSYYRY